MPHGESEAKELKYSDNMGEAFTFDVNPTSLTLQVIVNKSDKNYLEELF
jgi:hypothetical protein